MDELGIKVFFKLFSSDSKTFITTSYIMLLFAYLIRLIFRKSSFEYIQMMVAIFVFTISLNLTYTFWKDNEKFKMENRIISIKASSLGEEEKIPYISNAENYIKSLNTGILSEEKKFENTFFGVGNLLLWLILIILIRDLISFRKVLKYCDKVINKWLLCE